MTQNDLDWVELVRLDERNSRQARSLLYHSYRNEPTFRYLLNAERPGYRQRIRATIRELIFLHFERGETVFGVLDKANYAALAPEDDSHRRL